MSRFALRALSTSARALEAAAEAAPVAAVELRPEWTPKGKPQPTRPSRGTRVALPNGLPEPTSYPPSKSYLNKVEEMRFKGEVPKPHPLWAFFHVPAESMEVTADTKFPPDFGSVPRLENENVELKSGRSWSAPELRLKSFGDLHTLWYLLLRERNVIATQKAERKRLRVAPQYGGKLLSIRSLRCRKSMARIKYVLNERRLGAIAAAAPSVHAEATARVTVPFALRGINDPASQVEALAGRHPIPDVLSAEDRAALAAAKDARNDAILARKAALKAARRAAKRAEKLEQEMTDAEVEALVQAEEDVAKEEAVTKKIEDQVAAKEAEASPVKEEAAPAKVEAAPATSKN
ncbi:hypothetical protein CcaverHIS002_0202010 [Cutaneotrichosporon cavernicola]|uniref:Large ribosomal subunit protein uL29m n=1 Tax=Cutaneotrichosporon cavernicola TaxID=279322 RepID=A0AA48I3T5_9TREE|nr:uncharacterized protein CcaverHIS019_0202040 [Cutaneotrichosporon cavernicola]BEI81041.1 hypothetical protein CcaverHIS002_0202010 [Cutaneotrichosporon cavernicola]BEI88842.1 hypothetical protein CcaverHIS019_0202040 [Cutaneotrichosporon cavernicola]BEI96617.1 hypothetical protein CcaverHIS631_0202060 [Cutaneotrichosporon cavernicola]BEJ04389.1 hypothetical protein CcaverHIS641_0202060 [Cutaneotrichosporon cavernicola]